MLPLAGVHINKKPITKAHLEKAKTTGITVVRCEENWENKYTLKQVATWAFELGLKLCWITDLTEPGEKNSTSGKTFLEQFEELGANEKGAMVLIEFGNELWPGGSGYGPGAGEHEYTGKRYAENFCTLAAILRAAKCKVPLGMQVQTSEAASARTWMTQIGEFSHATLTLNLEPTADLPTGNWLLSHPYMGKMTLPQKEPNNLLTNEKCGEDTAGQKWGSQRWMKQQQLIKEWTGLTVPMAITEYGVCKGPGANSVPGETWAAVAEYCELFWQAAVKFAKGEWGTPPTGLTPVLALAIWYDLYAEAAGAETFGPVKTSDNLPNEEAGLFAKFKAGAEALGALVAPTVTKPANQASTVGVADAPLAVVATNATSYAATGLPVGKSINAVTGVITGTPTAVEAPTVSLTVTGPGGSATTTFVWSVALPVGGAPTLEPEAAYLYQQIGPLVGTDPAHGWAAAHLCAALMKPVELVMQLAKADGSKPGYRTAVDVDDAPAQLLPWLGQFNGTPLEDTEPAEEQRRKIREARGSHRGTTKAIISDVKTTVTGTQHAQLFERTSGNFTNLVVTRTTETASTAVTLAALNNRQTKPLGAVYTLITTETWLIAEIERAYKGRTVAEFEAAFATVKLVEEHGVI